MDARTEGYILEGSENLAYKIDSEAISVNLDGSPQI